MQHEASCSLREEQSAAVRTRLQRIQRLRLRAPRRLHARIGLLKPPCRLLAQQLTAICVGRSLLLPRARCGRHQPIWRRLRRRWSRRLRLPAPLLLLAPPRGLQLPLLLLLPAQPGFLGIPSLFLLLPHSPLLLSTLGNEGLRG